MVLRDINGALDVFAPLYHQSYGGDGFVSVEVDPGLAHDARRHRGRRPRTAPADRPPEPDGEDPGTARGPARHPADDRRGSQHQRHVDLQPRPLPGGDGGLHRRPRAVRHTCPAPTWRKVASVASFFISRVDTEIDHRLDAIGSPEALALRGKAAVAQGKLAYRLFQRTFSGPRWEALAARGAVVQRPLWASTSTKNPAYPDTLYVDELIGPDTVNTLPDATIEAFADHGTLARTRRRRRRRRPTPRGAALTDGRRRPRRRRRPSSSARAWPASRRASTSCSTRSTRRPPSCAPAEPCLTS